MATMNQSWNIRHDSSRTDHRVSIDGEARNEPQRIRATDEEVRKDWNALDSIFKSGYLPIEASLACFLLHSCRVPEKRDADIL